MSEIYEGPDSLRAYLTGAAAPGGGQFDHDLSLGGARSSARLQCLTPQRLTAFPGLRLRYVDGANGIGLGRLLAIGANTIRWAAPGDGYGDAVTIANGETKVLKSLTPSKFVVIARTSVLALSGVENIQLSDTYGNAIGMSDFTTAQSTAGEAKYRGFILQNVGDSNITDVEVWVDADLDDRLQVAHEATVDGAIQTIADELTQPTGLSWSTPTSGSPLVIGTVAAGATFGLWVERFCAALASANARVISAVKISYTVDGVTYTTSLRGAGRIAEAGIEGYLFWWGVGAEPDWLNTAHDEFSATLPVELAEELPEGTHYLVERFRNKYGIVGPPKQPIEVFEVAADLSLSSERPSGPSLVRVAPWTAGGYRVDATYIPDWDDVEYRATHWRIYVTIDGTDPDPETDTPIEQAMSYPNDSAFIGQVLLNYTAETVELEDTPVKALVRTYREENVDTEIPEAESSNTTIYETALEYCGPARPQGIAKYFNGVGIYAPPAQGPDGTPVVIDETDDIYWEMLPGETRLWYDDGTAHLISVWRKDGARDGWYTPLQHDGTDIDTTGSADAVDKIAWNGSKQLGFNVAGQRRCLFDITNNRIQSNGVFGNETPSGACQAVPVWQKYAHLVVMVWNADTMSYEGIASLDANGNWYCSVGFFPLTPEADCL